jgi:hypothetical protein
MPLAVWSQGFSVDEAARFGGVVGQDVAVAHLPAIGFGDGLEVARFDGVADLHQSRLDPDRPCTCEAKLYAVVTGRVVGRSKHRSRGVERTRGVEHLVGRDQAQHDNVGSG